MVKTRRVAYESIFRRPQKDLLYHFRQTERSEGISPLERFMTLCCQQSVLPSWGELNFIGLNEQHSQTYFRYVCDTPTLQL